MSDTVEKTSDGAIVYDTAILNQISEAAFSPAGWASATVIGGALKSGGRGNTLIVSDGQQEFVLRHYLRGGLPGRIIRDSYLWTGEDQTRSFAEWYLLAKLFKRGSAGASSRGGAVFPTWPVLPGRPADRPRSGHSLARRPHHRSGPATGTSGGELGKVCTGFTRLASFTQI